MSFGARASRPFCRRRYLAIDPAGPRSRASARSGICAASAGAISPRATAASTLVSTLPKIFDRPQRRQVDPERRRRVNGNERQRQELLGEGPQQLRLVVEQIRQRLRAQWPGG
jgi:hypothetical protein